MPRRIAALFLALLLALPALAQTASQATQPGSSPGPQQSQSVDALGMDVSQPRITDQQAKELFGEVSSILQWVSGETKLPIHDQVKSKLTSRAELQKYLEEHLDRDGGTERLKRSELVLKKFGLLPRTFDLEPFLVKLLREQVLGFYDPEVKTMFLLDWVKPDEQTTVLAHELTHALQDQ